jgi:hypothetical protein
MGREGTGSRKPDALRCRVALALSMRAACDPDQGTLCQLSPILAWQICDGSAMDDPSELRKLAEWYRTFAKVGSADQREGRFELAEHLERKAAELERRAANDPLSGTVTLC